MGAILGLLLQLAPSIIQGVEKLFAKPAAPVPGAPVPTGADKQEAVLEALRAILEKLIATGVAPAGVPVTDDALRGMIEAVFQQLKSSGQLTQQPTGALWLLQGTVSPLKIGV